MAIAPTGERAIEGDRPYTALRRGHLRARSKTTEGDHPYCRTLTQILLLSLLVVMMYCDMELCV